MRIYRFNYDVHIFDTDCYGVVWHGAYTKWLEMGRVNLFKSVDLDMKDMSDHHDIIFPVTEQNIRFRSPGRLGDVLSLSTEVQVEDPKLFFQQEVRHLKKDKILIEARTEVVAMNSHGRMYRKFPVVLLEKLEALNDSN